MWHFFLRQTLLLKYITLWPEKQKYDDDDDDDDDDGDELLLWYGWPRNSV